MVRDFIEKTKGESIVLMDNLSLGIRKNQITIVQVLFILSHIVTLACIRFVVYLLAASAGSHCHCSRHHEGSRSHFAKITLLHNHSYLLIICL